MKHILIFLILATILSACKKDKLDKIYPTSSDIEFAGCPTLPSQLYPGDLLDYAVPLKAMNDISGRVELDLCDMDGNILTQIDFQDIELKKGEWAVFEPWGYVPDSFLYAPRTFQLLLLFTKDGNTIPLRVAENGCNNPVEILVGDSLYGRAQGMFVNAKGDSLPETFTVNGETVVHNLAGNTNTGYIDAPSGSYMMSYSQWSYWTNVPPGAKYTMFRFIRTAAYGPNSTYPLVLLDSLTNSDNSKAYLRFVNLYDNVWGGYNLKKDGAAVPEFEDFYPGQYSSFIPFNAGVSNFTLTSGNTTIKTVNGVNLEAGKYYTIYFAGYYDELENEMKELQPKVISHN